MIVAVLGVGLIGGSVGLAARERLGAEVRGYDPAPGVLERALEHGAISTACASPAEALAGADGGVRRRAGARAAGRGAARRSPPPARSAS